MISQSERGEFNDSENQQTLNFLRMSSYKPSALFRFFYRQKSTAVLGWNSVGQRGRRRRRWDQIIRVFVHIHIYVYMYVRLKEREEWRDERRKKGRKKERSKERGIWPCWWTGLPGPRVSPRRRNGKSAAVGVRWTHSQPRKACLPACLPQPSSSTARICVRVCTPTHMHAGTPVYPEHTLASASVVEIITERIVVAFSRWQRIGRGQAGEKRGEGDLPNGPASRPSLRKFEDEDDDDDQETSKSGFSILEKQNTRLRHRGIRGRGWRASRSGMPVPRELGRSSSEISHVSSSRVSF